MGDIHAVLLVPAEGDPHGLLREGPCWARPPAVSEWRHISHTGGMRWARSSSSSWGHPDGGWASSLEWGETGTRALVLAWDGVAVRAGLLRYADAIGAPLDGPLGVVHWAQECLAGRGDVEPDEYGVYLRLDADGHEVTP